MAPEAHVEVHNAAELGNWDKDRFYIRKTLVATLYRPIAHDVSMENMGEIISIAPLRGFAINRTGKIIHNIGDRWIIRYHIRTYKDAPKHK